MKKLLITLPSHNEELVLTKTTHTLMQYAARHLGVFAWKILILDNASRDNTRAVAEGLQQQFPERILIDSVPTPGRGGALRESWARHLDYDIYAYMDVDLATDLKDFSALVNQVADGVDLATGSRYLPQSDSRRSPLRLFLSGVYNKLIRLVLRVNFRDAQCGFKAFSRRLVQELIPETSDRGWFWDTELMILACRRKYRVVELPVTWREVRDERRASTVTPWREAARQLKNIAWMWWRLRGEGGGSAKWLLAALLLVFIASRFLGLGQMYHQDEYKWVVISALGQFNPIHPPVASFLFQTAGKLFGFDHVRVAPILVSVLVWLLVYWLVARWYGRSAARWSGLILLVSVYNFLASIQIDIDGAFLPAFIVLLFYAFSRLDLAVWHQRRNYWWGAVLLLALAGGFLTKLSFVVAVAALLTEVLLLYRPSVKTLVKWGGTLPACRAVALA
jgi:glycosyltransferase involved in cell wall biosynthesis